MKLNNLLRLRSGQALKLIIAIVVSELAGVVGSVFTVSAIPNWYAGLAKPALNPPAWIFAPVWTTLYLLMGISLFLVWSFNSSQDKEQHSNILKNVGMLRIWKKGIALFSIQLILNALWSIIFFGSHSPGWALVEIIFLWLAIVATIVTFAKISKPAAWLLVPYILWVSFAGYLNYSIWRLNPSTSSRLVACTQEAKLCPDGTAVGRTGPNCEFAPCPHR